MKIVNLTPHPLRIYEADGVTLKRDVPSSGLARVRQTREVIGEIDGIPLTRSSYGEIVGLPEPQTGTFYMVSVYVLQAAQAAGRSTADLGCPDDFIRSEDGNIIGSRVIRTP